MIDHRRFTVLAAGAIDFGLTADEQHELDGHLRSCEDCRHVSREFRSQATSLRDRPRATPPFGMRDRVAVTWETGHRRQAPVVVLRLAVLAFVLLLAIIGLAIVGGGVHGPDLSVDPTVGPSALAVAPAAPRLPAIGTMSVIHVLAGPEARTGECSEAIESGCATDVIGAFGSIWVTSTDSVARLDASTGVVQVYIPMGTYPMRLVAAEGSLWATVGASGALVRIDPGTNKVVGSVEIGRLPAGVAVAAGTLWVAEQDSRTLVQVDPVSMTKIATIPLDVTPWEVAATDDAVWVSDRYAETLTRIDPVTALVVSTYDVPGVIPMTAWDYGDGVVAAGARVWTASGNQVSSFDPVTERFEGVLASDFSHPAPGQPDLWLVTGPTRYLRRLDPVTLETVAEQVIPIATPASAADWDASIAVTDDSIWIRSYGVESLIRVKIENRPTP